MPWLRVLVTLLALISAGNQPAIAAPPSTLVNPGFESKGDDGAPSGWTVITGLDRHRYGPPELKAGFDEVRPTVGIGGYRSESCLAFPAKGTWSCPVFTQSNGDGRQIDGRSLGKAAVFQTVTLPAGRYRFSAWLRSAEGHLYSATFSLGVNLGPAAAYAHDGSSGIQWTRHDLAMSRSFLRGVSDRGEWSRHATEPFDVPVEGPVTVWIRFNYVNENQMQARWQADDVAIEPVTADVETASCTHACSPAAVTVRWPQTAGDEEPWLLDPGTSSLEDAEHFRLFRRSRVIAPGDSVTYRIPVRGFEGPLWLMASAVGDIVIETAGTTLESRSGHASLPTTREWPLPATAAAAGAAHLDVIVRPAGQEPARLFELEVSRPCRTNVRLLQVEADTVSVPWVVGSWDASAREFNGQERKADAQSPRPEQLAPSGAWEIRFLHKPRPGHRYYLIHGIVGGTGRMDVGGNGLVDWVAETKGQEIVDLDVTDLLVPGETKVVVEATGEHDFAALVETCPGATDLHKLRLAFEGDERATIFTRVIDNTWFWLRELHYEPSGFIDASVPRGRWYSQYWPVDIGFALREWVRWGYADESVRVAAVLSGAGWHGHLSNRSGGADNTGGNIAALHLCEILRRADGTVPEPVDRAIWQRIEEHCEEAVRALRDSPFGLIRGTNWENAGNLAKGPCYALSTNLGAAAVLRKAAAIAEERGQTHQASAWRSTAARLRDTVLEKLVLRQDHRCPSGFVLPQGTWAYGLRTDGSIEDQPLAGYFWAAADAIDVEGLIAQDRELYAVYDRTLSAALPLFENRNVGTVSGYAASYDGPNAGLALAALCDRIDAFEMLLKCLSRETDTVHDIGSQHAELSRWAYGAPNDAEDTNLVCAAGFLWGLRVIVGVDDMLAEGRQIRLIPRLPWSWNRMHVNDWPVRARDVDGRPRWTRLSLELEQERWTSRGRVRSTDAIVGLDIRLGPFSPEAKTIRAQAGDARVETRLEQSGDATWAWIRVDSGPGGVTWKATVER